MKRYQNWGKKLLFCSVLATVLSGSGPVWADTNPSYFNWRYTNPTDVNSGITYDVVGPIRDQGNYGTCWTFGSLASYESSWNRQLKAAGLLTTANRGDFSERYLAWTTYSLPTQEADKGQPHYSLFYYDPERAWAENVYNQGGWENMTKQYMQYYGVVKESDAPYNTTNMTGVPNYIVPKGLLHDAYNIGCMLQTPIIAKGENITRLKDMIRENGVVTVYSEWKSAYADVNTKEVCYTGPFTLNHCVSIVGWDDNYVFKSSKLKGTGTGAWIVRNSWGSDDVNGGYWYMSYNDTSLNSASFHVAELDSARYTLTDGYFKGSYYDGAVNLSKSSDYNNTSTIAGAYKSSGNQFLKAVSFVASNPDMNYTITIRTGTVPGAGTIIGQQTGKFGTDGTSSWEGWRTVDLNKYVFLPKDTPYLVEVTTSNGDKSEALTFLWSMEEEAGKSSLYGRTFYYDYQQQKWFDVAKRSNNPGEYYIADITARGKDAALANGADFTVSYLNDDGVGGTYIYLGKADELYGTDILHPDRKTLSNMTVELTAGLTDSTYGGVIYGEGGLTKTGTGVLTLLGENLYTGNTNVAKGTLNLGYMADGSGGSLLSAVNVLSGASLTGNGVIYNSLTNSGTVSPGNSIGALTVDSYQQNVGGILRLESNGNAGDRLYVKNNAYIDGTVHFVPVGGYFANGENALYVKNFVQAKELTYGPNLDITGEDVNTQTVQVTAVGNNLNNQSGIFYASRGVNAYSQFATTDDGYALGKALDKVAGYQTTADRQNLVAGIDFSGLNIDNLGAQLEPRAYDSLMTVNMKNRQFVGKSLVDTMLEGVNHSFAHKAQEEKNEGIFAQALRYSSHQNSWSKYDSYDNMVSGVLVGYEREARGWRYGVHGAYLSGSTDVNSAAPLHNDYYSGMLGLHGIKNMNRDFLYGFVQGSWERNEANRQVNYDSFARRQEAKWNGTGFSIEVGGGHNFRSEKRQKSLTPYASLNYSRLHWGSIEEDCSAGDSMSISRDSSNYNSLVGTLGIRAQVGPHKMTGSNAKISYDTTVAYEHEFLNNMPGYEYNILGAGMYQDGYKKPARDVVSVAVGASIISNHKFTLRADIGKSWGSQGYSALQAGVKGEWKF